MDDLRRRLNTGLCCMFVMYTCAGFDWRHVAESWSYETMVVKTKCSSKRLASSIRTQTWKASQCPATTCAHQRQSTKSRLRHVAGSRVAIQLRPFEVNDYASSIAWDGKHDVVRVGNNLGVDEIVRLTTRTLAARAVT